EAILEPSIEEAWQGGERQFQVVSEALCPTCQGRGWVRAPGQTETAPCPVCGGIGEIRRSREVKTRIPARVKDGTRLRVRRQAGEGDLYLTVRLRLDPRFTIDGADLE